MRHSEQTYGEQERLSARPVELIAPVEQTSPFIFASPHSGRRYPASFIAQTDIDLITLRRSEDSYVDLLVDMVPSLGAPLIKALFPRAYVDVNRSEKELDPLIFNGQLPDDCDTRSSRVLAGFGVIPRLAANGQEIYRARLPLREAMKRLQVYYAPYHRLLQDTIDETVRKFGCAIVIDCHSMPSQEIWRRPGKRLPEMDFVLGDRYGASCAPGLLSLTQNLLMEAGYRVARNAPYAGGYVTQNYGQPATGVHALQIEINRRLYLDEARITRTAGFEPLRSMLRQILKELMQIDPAALQISQAAE